MAYPKLVLRGVSKTRKFKWLVKVGASIYQTPDFKKNLGWGEGFPGNKKNPGYATDVSKIVASLRSKSSSGNDEMSTKCR